MAGDWIKMRVNLVTHPKVLAISEYLASCGDFQDWSTMAGFVPSCGGTQADYDRDYQDSLRVTRYVTVCALLRFWGYANEHARNEFISTLRVSDLDEIVQVPSFGAALVSIGWVVYDTENRGIHLPNFNEYNCSGNERSAKAKTNAERQREYRDRKKLPESNQESNVTRNVTSNRREEKSREEKNREEKKNTDTDTPDGVSLSVWQDFKAIRKTKKAALTKTVINKIRAQADKAGVSLQSALETCCERGWASFNADWLADKQKAYTPHQPNQTVPSKPGIDPTLARLIHEQTSGAVKPPSAEMKARLAQLRGVSA